MKKVVKKRKPGGGRRTIIEGVEMVRAVVTITQAQKDHWDSLGKGNISEGARIVTTRDMARSITEKSNES
jgi:hypothetical protein